eukprot:3295518-Amphidinium_carterae.1
MGQESTTAVQWMREMESAADALDFDLYVEEKKREAVTLCFRLVVLTDKTALGIVKQVGNQDGFVAFRTKFRLAIRYAPRTLGRNLTRLTSIIDHDFGFDESQMLDRMSAWERQKEEQERISGGKIADSVSEVRSDPEGNACSIEDLPSGKLPQRVRLDSDATSNKGKDGKGKGHNLDSQGAGTTKVEKEAKVSRKTRVAKAKARTKAAEPAALRRILGSAVLGDTSRRTADFQIFFGADKQAKMRKMRRHLKECEDERMALSAEGEAADDTDVRLDEMRLAKKQLEVVVAIVTAAQKYGLSSKGFQEIVLQETHRMSLDHRVTNGVVTNGVVRAERTKRDKT